MSVTLQKAFTPNVIGPGATTELRFTVTNSDGAMVVAIIRVDTDPRKGCRLTGSRRTPTGGENARCTFLFEFLEWRFESLARSPGSLHA